MSEVSLLVVEDDRGVRLVWRVPLSLVMVVLQSFLMCQVC